MALGGIHVLLWAAVKTPTAVLQQSAQPRLPYVARAAIVADLPHTPRLVEGLASLGGGVMVESFLYPDANNNHNHVRAIDTRTGRELRNSTAPNTTVVPPDIGTAAMGIAVLDARVLQATWDGSVIFEYRAPSLDFVRAHVAKLGSRNAGLAADGSSTLYSTDGACALVHVDASSFEVMRTLPIIDNRLGRRVCEVYDLTFVGDELWGTLYPLNGTDPNSLSALAASSECLVRLDPTSGTVLGWVDVRGLLEQQQAVKLTNFSLPPSNYPYSHMMSGVEYARETRTLVVTGKEWDRMYHLRAEPAPELGPEHVERVCQLSALV